MIPRSGYRFAEKIMLKQRNRTKIRVSMTGSALEPPGSDRVGREPHLLVDRGRRVVRRPAAGQPHGLRFARVSAGAPIAGFRLRADTGDEADAEGGLRPETLSTPLDQQRHP